MVLRTPVIIEQLFRNGIHGGEEKLMLAVLQDAVECFQKHVLAQYPWDKKLFQEAENWILAKNTDWSFSFENICETLQLHPGYLRQGLLRWKEAKRKIGSPEEQQRVGCRKSVKAPPDTSIGIRKSA